MELDHVNEKRNYGLKMTYELFQKINNISKFVSDTVGEDYECVGLLVNDQNKDDDVARDVILIPRQNVTYIKGRFGNGNVQEVYKATYDQGKKIIGMFHSHGSIGVCHSSDDDNTLEYILGKNIEHYEDNTAVSIVINNKTYANDKSGLVQKKTETTLSGE